jgi:hypothetical protein
MGIIYLRIGSAPKGNSESFAGILGDKNSYFRKENKITVLLFCSG